MSSFEIWVLVFLGAIAGGLFGVNASLDKSNRHLSNIADRLLDLWRQRDGRR